MLCEKYDREFLERHLLPRLTWKPFPKAESRNAWKSMLKTQWKKKISSEILAEAKKAAKCPCQELPASLYMDFMRTGNRSNYETPYFKRRSNLGFLVLAECFLVFLRNINCQGFCH